MIKSQTKYLLFGILLVLCSGCITQSGQLTIPKPNIILQNFDTEEGFDPILGFYADSTVTLVNTGTVDGIATISIENEDGKVFDSFDVLVPVGKTAHKTVRADISLSDERINCNLISAKASYNI